MAATHTVTVTHPDGQRSARLPCTGDTPEARTAEAQRIGSRFARAWGNGISVTIEEATPDSVEAEGGFTIIGGAE